MCIGFTIQGNKYPILQASGAPNDRFLSDAFRLSGLLLKLCRLILGCAKKNYLFGYFRGT